MERKQVKWIDIEKEQPVQDQFVFYISQEDIDTYHYDDPESKYWSYDFGTEVGLYWNNSLVEYNCDSPMVKIKYWSPAPRFDWDIY